MSVRVPRGLAVAVQASHDNGVPRARRLHERQQVVEGPALGTDVYGTLTWPGGDVRSVHGWYPYNSGSESIYPSPSGDIDARLEVRTDGDPDLWDLVIDGNSMARTGRKSGGGSYAVSLTKS